jgi:hypothetical protein
LDIRFSDSPPTENMTLHYVMATGDSGLVWVTETGAFLSHAGKTEGAEKVAYMPDLKIAYGPWGDLIACDIGSRFAESVKTGAVDLTDPESVKASLRQIGRDQLPEKEKGVLPQHQDSRGIILVTLDGAPRAYQLCATWPPCAICVPHLKAITAGDVNNSARLFIDHYYALSGKSTAEAIAIGLHAMRLAIKANPSTLGEPNVWFHQNGEFKRLNKKDLTAYSDFSRSVDDSVLDRFRTAPKPT